MRYIFHSLRVKKLFKTGLLGLLLLVLVQPVRAADTSASSIFSNPLAVTLIILMLLLLIIIAVLANLLIGVADIKMKKRKKAAGVVTTSLVLLLVFISPSLFAQDAAQAPQPAIQLIGGMSASTFYIMAAIIFLELFIILMLLINVRFLVKTEKDKLAYELIPEQIQSPKISWWSRFNKFKPVDQESTIDLGHDYDGIRELDNRLPPWWLYGFYISILVAGIYLWRFHISHTGPSSKEEYENSVQVAELKIQEYLKKKGDAVNENTVTVLTSADDIGSGKKIFTTSCAACHKEAGGGDVGPNLTDDYWLHGGDVKSIFKVVKYGYNAMPQWQNAYSNKQLAQVSSYIKSLRGTNPPNAKAPQGELYKEETPSAKPPGDSANVKENKVVMN